MVHIASADERLIRPGAETTHISGKDDFGRRRIMGMRYIAFDTHVKEGSYVH
jgi:hypothetical protein